MPTVVDIADAEPGCVGVYTPHHAGALAGVSGQTIGQWARHGLVTPTVYKGRPANLYSYFDVAEAIVVRWLLDKHRISHAQIRFALSRVRDDYPKWPLLHAPIGIGHQSLDDPGRLVYQHPGGREAYVDVSGEAPDQIVIRPQLLDRARDMLAHGGWIADDLGLSHIEVDPRKLGGQPSLRDRRWAVDHVARLAADDEGREILIESYGLDASEVDEAVAWVDGVEALA